MKAVGGVWFSSRWPLAVALLLAMSTVSRSQIVDTAVISGLVKDSSGGAIVNADVSLRNAATGVEHKTTSNEEGIYVSPPLQPGDYDVVVKVPGFDTVVQHVRLGWPSGKRSMWSWLRARRRRLSTCKSPHYK